MSSYPKVSILVPVYGVENYISQCAESLFIQDYPNIEYVFINDCTPDNSIKELSRTVELFPEKKEQIKIIDHPFNKGLAAARNTALLHSTGDYVLPVDSDDYLLNKHVVSELVVSILKGNCDAVFFDFLLVPQKKHIKLNVKQDPINLTQLTLARMAPSSLCCGIYKKDLFIKNGIFSRENISFGEDYAIKPKLTYFMSKINYIPVPYYCYRVSSDESITHSFKDSHIFDIKSCINGFYDFFSSFDDYSLFKNYIRLGEVRCKIMLLDRWKNFSGNNAQFSLIQKSFPKRYCRKKFLSWSEYFINLASLINAPFLIRHMSLLKFFSRS